MSGLKSRILATCAFLAAAALATTGPSAAAGQMPRSAPSTAPLKHATNLCFRAVLYSWPADASLPERANVQPAEFGERFEIRAGPRRTLGSDGFYETTIPIGAGFGTGPYYWVSERCFNPS